MKRLFFLCSGFIFLSSAGSFADPGKTIAKPGVDASSGTDPKLYQLYLRNFAPFNELDSLFGIRNPGNHRIVLQFYVTSTGRITLMVFGGRKRNRKYNLQFNPILTADTAGTPCGSCDISGGNIVLNDQQISRRHRQFKILKGYIGKPAMKYIVFTPTVVDNLINKTTRVKTIQYEIGYTNSVTDKNLSSQIIATPAGFGTNPSPPRNGN